MGDILVRMFILNARMELHSCKTRVDIFNSDSIKKIVSFRRNKYIPNLRYRMELNVSTQTIIQMQMNSYMNRHIDFSKTIIKVF